jgi:hypothetical protein
MGNEVCFAAMTSTRNPSAKRQKFPLIAVSSSRMSIIPNNLLESPEQLKCEYYSSKSSQCSPRKFRLALGGQPANLA